MTGVFLKLSEIIRYFDGDTNLDNLMKGEPFYYDESLFCNAIISRTKDNIKFLFLMDRDEPMQRDTPPNPIEVSGSLNISSAGEFLIDEFNCLDCNDNKCMHVAAHLVFMNRHNINKSEQFKPSEVAEARKMVIYARYNAVPLSEMFKKQEHCQHDSDSSEEDEGTENIQVPRMTEEEKKRYFEAIFAAAPNSMLAQVLKAGMTGKAKEREPTMTEQPSTSTASATTATSTATTSKSPKNKKPVKKSKK